MIYAKKSLGQNFLIDNNVVKNIIKLTNVKNKNVIEIGPGKGALTYEILKKRPKSLKLVEKDFNLAGELNKKYFKTGLIKVFNDDILKLKLDKIIHKNTIIFGNLPYNISSQIFVKILRLEKLHLKIEDIILMFQKELGEKIICKYPSANYGRLSILMNLKLNFIKKFYISPNCFFPKPKVTSIVIHFKPKKNILSKIKKIENLEKITNILFSNKRKMINKNIKKVLNEADVKKIFNLKLNLRPAEISPNIYYKITELFEKK